MQVLPGYYTVPGSIYTRQLRTARAHKPSQMAMALSAAQLAEFEERGFVTVGTPPPARMVSRSRLPVADEQRAAVGRVCKCCYNGVCCCC